MSRHAFRLSLYLLAGVVLIAVAVLVISSSGARTQALPAANPLYNQAKKPVSAAGLGERPGQHTDQVASTIRGAGPQTRTDATGRYRFERLPRGTHKVTLDPATLPPALRPTEGENVPALWLVPGQEQTSDALASGVRFAAAYNSSGAISGHVFLDRDGDGRQGAGEMGLAGVTVIDPTIHEYFVPFDDRNLIEIFRASNACQGQEGPGGMPIGYILTSGVSVVASSNGTVYYYDHWEDGYDADPLQPGPTTEWGTLSAGQYQPFLSEIDTRLVGSGPPYYHDGGDRLTVVGEDVAVIRYAYPSFAETGIGPMFAGAWEIEQTANWGTEYIIPAGQDWGAQSDFAFTAASIMAAQDNTQVYFRGAPTLLNRGQTLFVNGGLGGLINGETFTATGPIMGSLYASICDLSFPGNPWSGNGYTLEPLAHWTSDYWSPVPSRNTLACDNTETDIFVYNDNPADITVTVDDGTATNITLPARSSSSVRALLALQGRSLSSTRGVHLVARGGERFWGVVNFDTRRSYYEWGFSLVHDPSSQVILGWSPGNATLPPSGETPPNGNMAWVTPVTDTVVFVDLTGDGVPDNIDCNGNGNATDVGVDGICNEPTSNQGITLTQGVTLRVGDPVNDDLSGARIYSRNFNEKITVAWGEDSCVALRPTPYLDLGYTVLPITSHTLAITKTAEPSPVRAGGILTYTLAWSVSGFSPALDVTISDTVPASMTLIAATLPVTINGALLTWPLGDRVPGDSGAVTFSVRVAGSVVSGTLLRNVAVITDSSGISETSPITTPVVTAPALELSKSVTPGEVVRGMPFTYTIRVTNTGQMTFTTLVLTDTLPPDFHYVAGSGVPSAPDVVAEPLLRWNNLGILVPDASTTVAFAVTSTQSITGTYINTATVEGRFPTGVLTDTKTVPVILHDPEIALVKRLAGFDQDQVSPNFVTFTIAIANVGPSVIDVLPLHDQYDTYYLSFVQAAPMPDEPQDDGDLTWLDLTAPSSHGFGRNLAPGEEFTITTVFVTIRDITTTINTAVVTGAIDIYGNPANRPRDAVPISSVPTAVELLYWRAESVSGQQVRLAWATAMELDNLGFNLYRAAEDDRTQASLIHFEPAAALGGRLGASYVYTDTAPSDGVWWYWLADVSTEGAETQSTLPAIRADVNTALRYRFYLPVMVKGS